MCSGSDRERARKLIAAARAEAEQLGMARELVRFPSVWTAVLDCKIATH